MATRTSNDGKLLERLVKLIQIALKNVNNTTIESNVKVAYKLGRRKGQIDVLITTQVNGFTYRTAIECKDYSRPVAAEKVDAFSSKCNRLIGIDKRVLVSRSGFQSGADDAAYASGVALYNLDDISEEAIQNWVNPEGARQVSVERVELIIYQIILEHEKIIKQEDLNPLVEIFLSNGETLPLANLILQTEKQFHSSNARYLADKLNEEGLLDRLDELFPVRVFSFFGPTEDLSLCIKTNFGKKLTISRIEFGVDYHCRISKPVSIKVQGYTDTSIGDRKAEILTLEINNSSINLIKVKGGEVKMFVTDSNGSTEELIELPPFA